VVLPESGPGSGDEREFGGTHHPHDPADAFVRDLDGGKGKYGAVPREKDGGPTVGLNVGCG
jgi:hypothetical protein